MYFALASSEFFFLIFLDSTTFTWVSAVTRTGHRIVSPFKMNITYTLGRPAQTHTLTLVDYSLHILRSQRCQTDSSPSRSASTTSNTVAAVYRVPQARNSLRRKPQQRRLCRHNHHSYKKARNTSATNTTGNQSGVVIHEEYESYESILAREESQRSNIITEESHHRNIIMCVYEERKMNIADEDDEVPKGRFRIIRKNNKPIRQPALII